MFLAEVPQGCNYQATNVDRRTFEVFNKYKLVNYQEEAYYLAPSLYLERVYVY